MVSDEGAGPEYLVQDVPSALGFKSELIIARDLKISSGLTPCLEGCKVLLTLHYRRGN